MGNGTNLIVSDSGYSGVIIKLADNFAKITAKENEIIAQAGASLAAVSNAAWKASLTGLEFASGIPGTIGGAVAMNAGAYDGEMKDVVTQTTSLDENGEIVQLHGEEHEFGYRKSFIQKRRMLVLEATLKLQKGDPDKIKEKMQSLNARRREKQPLNLPSAGSVFKRPPDHFAGKLIEEAGLRGYQIGGAQVSDKHCGFIVNTGDATAADIIALIQWVKDKVFQTSGVMLEEEVKILGG
jgi:UDP-N-acetylmuramate dehydrogenase